MLMYLVLIPLLYLIISVSILVINEDIRDDSQDEKEEFLYPFFKIPHMIYDLLPLD
jgi:hypothetical protein